MLINKVIDLIRLPLKQFMSYLAAILNKISGGRITPTSITLTGFSLHILIAILIATQHYVWAAVLLLIFGMFDALDGALARLQKSDSPRGMLLDSITDKIKEVMLHIGIAYALVATGKYYYAVWSVAACGASILVSYVNAWGEVLVSSRKSADHTTNKSFRSGIMTFEIRMTVVFFGLLFNVLPQMVVFLSISSMLTALGRVKNVYKKL